MSAELLQRLAEAGTPLALVMEVAEALAEARAAERILEKFREKDAERSNRRRALLPEDWDAIRGRVFERDGFRCTYCGAEHRLQCDHIIPLSAGGSNDLENLTTACKSCNCSKGARTPEEWRGA